MSLLLVDGRARQERLAQSRLYLVLEARPHGEDPLPLLKAARRGGVDVVQLRGKQLDDSALIASTAPFRAACEEHGALFLLNDRPDLVEACGADGVHVGRSDPPVDEARALMGADGLVGLSVPTRKELAAIHGADYVGVTAFATPTKEDAVGGGLELVRAAAAAAQDSAYAPRCVNQPPLAPSWKTTVFSPLSSTSSK